MNEYSTKYYVVSGNFAMLILNESPLLAAFDCYDVYKNEFEFEQVIYVSEKGFRSDTAEFTFDILDLISWFSTEND